MGNARLLSELSTLLPFSSSAQEWSRRLQLATHVADVRFVEASLSANALVDTAQQAASVLQDPRPISNEQRSQVRRVLEKTVRQLVPFERTQGACLLSLGRVMLEAVGAIYLGRSEGMSAERRRKEDKMESGDAEEDGEAEGQGEAAKMPVPENELVRETRQVLIRGERPDIARSRVQQS